MRSNVWSQQMTKVVSFFLLAVLFTSAVLAADNAGNDVQLQKEHMLAEMLKKLVTCKNMEAYEDGDRYCFVRFRGLQLDFAGVNAKSGGTIYVTALGINQTLSARGSRCILIAFDDPDLRGTIAAHILFRNDGVITHTSANKKAWAECQ